MKEDKRRVENRQRRTVDTEIYGKWTGPIDKEVDYDGISLKCRGSLQQVILNTETVLSVMNWSTNDDR